MAVTEEPMRWWGWGDPAHDQPPPAHALAWLGREIGGLGAVRRPVGLDEVRLAPGALPAAVGERFGEILRDDRLSRVVHARGKSYPDLVRQRAGDGAGAPDAVLHPRSHDEVRAVLEACAHAGVVVVPFGGGTSVVGGVEPVRDGAAAAVALDLGRLNGVVALDARSRIATVAAGTRGPALETALVARGFTLGHFPQSFEHVTIGGCVATRSAGQASTGYGRIDDLVLGVRLAAPAGDLDLPAVPATAAGPGLRGLVVGSEGTLGVITSVALSVVPRPAARRYEGFVAPTFAAGVEAFRRLAQEGAAPDVARLSDAGETRTSLALAGNAGAKAALARRYLRARGVADGCLAIVGWEGDVPAIRARRGPRRRSCAPRVAWVWGPGRDARGCADASMPPTCATTCSIGV